MAWRFKASKYKNAAPIVPKPEACIRDICVGSYQTYGNNICASASFMAFNWEHVGSSMAVLPLEDCGRKSKTMPLLHAHSDTITDMEFSPFHDGLLLTGSQDSLVKVWHIPPEGLKESLSTPECTLSQKQRRVENVGFHPVADGLIHVASGHELALWDLTKQKETFVNKDHTEVIQSTSWKKDGKLVATSCKDKKVRILDPRSSSPVLGVANSHQNIKDSRLVWLGDSDRILTTGFDSARLRQIMIRDIRNLSQTQKTLELDCSTGVLMPLYDADTNMLFLAGKGDTTILYMELCDREPYLIEGLRHSGEQTKGACLVPKRALRVMEGEVNRVLQLAGTAVVPVMYQVPRKSYREYHADLFPATRGAVPQLNAPLWLAGRDAAPGDISLRPDDGNLAQIHRGDLEELLKAILSMPVPMKGEQKPLIQQTEEPAKVVQKTTPEQKEKEEDRIDFVNVKDMIKGMEKQKVDPKDYPKETNGFHKKITDNGHDFDNELKGDNEKEVTKSERSLEKTESSDSSESLSRSNSLINGVPAQVPKPLPRSSISEGSSADDQEAPKPKPRTSTMPVAGYKPRLGPKPFSAATGNEEFSFDKVFSVPVVPGLSRSDSASPGSAAPVTSPGSAAPVTSPGSAAPVTSPGSAAPVTSPGSAAPVTSPGSAAPVTSPGSAAPAKDDEKEKSLSPTSDVEAPGSKEEYTNGKSDTSVEEEVSSSDSGYRPKTPSTAERRRMFENTESMSVPAPASPAPLRRRDSVKSRKSPDREEKRSSVPNVTTKRTSTVFGKVSKFRHLKGTPGHKSTHVENIKNISRQISGECNGFYANGVRCALPLSGGSGRLGVVELPRGATPRSASPRGGSPHTPGPPALLHTAPLQDWAFDPFRDDRLLVACDDGMVREWILPEGGLQESTNEPNRTFSAHPDKIYIIRFHPTTSDILTTAAHDQTIKIWDLSQDVPTAEITLTGHTDQIFALDWSPCGEYLATVCKDSFIRVFSPRSRAAPLRRGPAPGARGGRVVWALGASHLVVTGFDKVSERQILLYKASDLSAPVCTVGLDVSPAILQTHIDHDSSTLFLTGRGDSTIYCYEVTCESPYICALSHHRAASLHQGIAFLPKNLVAVEKVEFARALRLTNGTIEPLSFTVPRIKSELFQDDLFPPTLVTWEPWQSAASWLAEEPVAARTASLQPPGMEPLSAHAVPAKEKPKPKPDLIKSHVPMDPKDKQDSIMKSMSAKVTMNLKLEQDSMEGVDESEWEH